MKTETLEEIANMCVWEFSYKHKGGSFYSKLSKGNPLYLCQHCDTNNRKCKDYLTVGEIIHTQKENLIYELKQQYNLNLEI